MKKTATLFLSLVSVVAFAQSGELLDAPAKRQVADAPAKKAYKPKKTESSASTIYWSEDFSNGIPSTWTQVGNPSAALWEYRGPSTTPNNGTGSQGAYAAANDPITSTTASNGFIIFDSDYLDNAGVAGAFGTGAAPAPHLGTLTTDTIDLSNETAVEIKLETYSRRFEGLWSVAISTDGGVSFPDTFNFAPESVIGVNEATPNAATVIGNISSIVAGQPYVQLRFVFDGVGLGYYFCMIDDIELRSPPSNQLYLSRYNVPGGGEAPPRDMIYNNGNTARYGVLNSNQAVPINFDGNILNYGATNQSNVSLDVEVVDLASGSVVSTLTTSGCANLAPGEICPFDSLTTAQWTPSVSSSYAMVWKAKSDSTTAVEVLNGGMLTGDSIPFYFLDDLYSLDRGITSNFVGTNTADPELITMAIHFSLNNEDPDSAGSGLVFVDGVDIVMSTATDETGQIQIELNDTNQFLDNASLHSQIFSLAGTAGITANFPLGSQDSVYNGTTWDPAWKPVSVPVGEWYVVLNLTPNATDGVIRMANDATFEQDGFKYMQTADGSWYGGFTSSAYEGVHVRLNVAEAPQADISIAENNTKYFAVYPNPTNGIANLEFDMPGDYDITVFDMTGNMVHSEIYEAIATGSKTQVDFSDVSAGVYLVNIKGDHMNTTYKLTVQ